MRITRTRGISSGLQRFLHVVTHVGFLLFVALASSAAIADPKAASNLQTETMLHPMDGFSGDTLKQGEVIYNQSPFTLPVPSWFWIGATDWLTVEFDSLPLLGGFFVDPHLPVPSFNVRFRLLERRKKRPSIAFEVMWQHLWKRYAQEDREHLLIERKGSSVFARLNLTQELRSNLYLHISAGATWAQSIRIANRNRDRTYMREFTDSVTPDMSVAVDWRVHPRISLHTSVSYGTTFTYADNQPRKMQAFYGFRLAPFYRHDWAFLRYLRMEFPAFFIYYPDAKEVTKFEVPLVPFLYWQWKM